MTENEVLRVINLWMERLKLQHWEVFWTDFEGLPPGAPTSFDSPTEMALVYRSRDYNHAYLVLREDWKKWTSKRLNEIVVHELTHVMMRELEQIVDLIEDHVASQTHSILRDAHEHALEGAVDFVAVRLVELAGEA